MLEADKDFANVTDCLDDTLYYNKWEIKEINARDYEAVIMCSDGISDSLHPDKKIDLAFDLVKEYKNTERKKRKNEISKSINEWNFPGNSDDRTIACLYREDLQNE